MKTSYLALASGLLGFRSSTLRVRVLELRNGCAWIVTADLLDVGTRLVIDERQLSALEEVGGAGLVHRSGLLELR
jgi:hypothetical protein